MIFKIYSWLLVVFFCFVFLQGIFMVFHFSQFTIVNDAFFCLAIRINVFEVH